MKERYSTYLLKQEKIEHIDEYIESKNMLIYLPNLKQKKINEQLSEKMEVE